MKWFRWVTWYFQFAERWTAWAASRQGKFAQVLLAFFYLVVPGAIGALAFYVPYVLGLTKLFPSELMPGFLSREGMSVAAHGSMTFAIIAIGLAFVYGLVGMICLFPDALKPPKFQNKRHPWKDWPDD